MNTALQIIGSLFIVVFIHEIGHYLVARLCGVRVSSVSIFFGTIFKFRISNTWFHIGFIPMGGYTVLHELDKIPKGEKQFIYGAGIYFNVLTYIGTLFFYHEVPIVNSIGIISLAVALVNLIPADPFDGKKIFR